MGDEMMRKIITMLFLVGIMFFGTISDGKTAKALSGKGTADDPFLVSTAQDLRTVTADLKGYYLQTADIDLKYQDFPIIAEYDNPGFQGTYDGNNFKIKNLKIQKSELPLNTGLFGRCDNATIKRVHLVNVEIENTTNKSGYLLGGIVGKAVNTTISDCHVTGEGYIKNGLKAGGIAGWIPVFVLLVSAAIMAFCGLLIKKCNMKWLETYALAISMVGAMIFAVVITPIIG